jgi:hypothetical protein
MKVQRSFAQSQQTLGRRYTQIFADEKNNQRRSALICVQNDEVERQRSPRGWEVLRSLGHDAQPGRLPNAAVEHDRYLYGKERG